MLVFVFLSSVPIRIKYLWGKTTVTEVYLVEYGLSKTPWQEIPWKYPKEGKGAKKKTAHDRPTLHKVT